MKNRKLTTAETDTFIQVYPTTSNKKLVEMFGINKKNVEYLARKYRLKKSLAFLQASWARGARMRHAKK